MGVHAGTSGFSYAEWKGPFYPEKLPQSKMLRFYAERLPTVEINNTFYRLPNRKTLEKWAQEVPDEFVFALKASRRITHVARLKEADELMAYLFDTVSSLGPSLGPLLFQLPPYLKKNTDRLCRFLKLLPKENRVTLEFRHDSWHDEEVHAHLLEHNVPVTWSHMDKPEKKEDAATAEKTEAPWPKTADWGYLRLRQTHYSEDELQQWAKRVAEQQWKDVFVFFKHEDECGGPPLAKRFLEICSELGDASPGQGTGRCGIDSGGR